VKTNRTILKGGFIGLGRMGLTHYSILNKLDNIEIVAVCDNSKSILNIFGKYVPVKLFKNSEDMFNDCKLDFVIISTPPGYHHIDIKKAIYSNVNIFVEKPFVMDLDDGEEIIALIEKKDLINQVGYNIRHNDSFLKLKEILDQKIIGDIKTFRSEMFGSTIQNSSNSSWRDNKTVGGGCIYEFASHAIDLIFNYFGSPNKIIGSTIQKVYSKNTDDLVQSTFLYNNNLTGSLIANWSDASFRKPTNRILLFGTNGSIVADKYSLKIFLKQTDKINNLKKGWNTLYITDIFEPVKYYVRGYEYTRQLNNFIDSIVHKKKIGGPSFHEAFEIDIIINRIIENSKENQLRIIK